MTNWIEDIKQLAADDSGEVTRQWLERTQQDAPYSVLPQLLFLKHNGVKGNEDVLAQLAIAFPDRRALALMLGEDAGLLTDFYPPEALPETPDTATTIDRFLDNYGKTSPSEVEAISRAIFTPQPDYADVLAAQEKEEGGVELTGGDTQDMLINQFIAEQMQLGFDEVLDNLEHLIQRGTRIDISYFVDEVMEKDCQDELFDYFDEVDGDVDKAISEFDGIYQPEEIRLARLVWKP